MTVVRDSSLLWTSLIGLMLTVGQPAARAQCDPRDYYGPQTQAELTDIVFLIDGSSSMSSVDFEIQKSGIRNCIVGPNAFIPQDGTVAVGVIQFSTIARAEIHLSVIDGAATANEISQEIDQICQMGELTRLDRGLLAAIDMFTTEAYGDSFYLVVSTDVDDPINPENPNVDDRLQLAEEIRTKTLRAATMAHPATICTVFVPSQGACSIPPEDTPNPFLRLLANTADSGSLLDPARPGEPAYLNQPVGHFNCCDGNVQHFVALCSVCTCSQINAGGPDCNQNGIPDVCESGDCDGNGIPDVCDILSDPSKDCNENDVLDECDIATGYSWDCDANGVPDECQPNNDEDEFIDACDNCPTVTNPGQEDCELDGIGDACETDTDGDLVPDDCDNCPTVGNPGQENCDTDTEGDACDSDDDDDGILDDVDNCDCVPNIDQVDCDGDGFGNACDPGGYPLADFDQDCDVDHTDFAHVQECWTNGPISPECQDAYLSGTWLLTNPYYPMIAYGDVVLFERCATGPGILADPACGDCDNDGIPDGLDSGPPCDTPGDQDCDGVEVEGRSICGSGQTTNCDDNCPCVPNGPNGGTCIAGNIGAACTADGGCGEGGQCSQAQEDSDGDGIGDACDSTPFGPPQWSPPPDPCETPESYFTITAWRSVRTHETAGQLSVALDPDAAPDSAVIEPRQGNVQIIEVDLAQPAFPWTDLDFVYVAGSDASRPWPMSYDFVNNDQTFRLFFDATDPDNRLNDQVCYTIDLSAAIVDANLTTGVLCDADCTIRMLAADADANAAIEQADVNAIAAANGQTADASNVRLDVNVDGVINATDQSITSSLLSNTVTCGGGMMMIGMGEATEGVDGADALVGTSQAPNLLTLLRQAAIALPPSANVSAQWVVHGTGATSVTLPAGGGTISVDLVVTTDAPIWGLEGKPAVDAAGVVSINSADWTELDNVLFSHDVDGHNQSSCYDLTVVDWLWVRLTPDGTDVTAWGMDVDSLLGADPPTVWTLTQDLAVINGPIATPAVHPPIEVQDSAQWFTTTASIGGVTREPLPAGQTVLATLSLTISAEPGTYHLTLTDSQFVDITYAAFPTAAVQPLEIVIQGQ